MTKKLLNKTTQSIMLVAIAILLVAAPLFYRMSHWLYVYEADEILRYHQQAFFKEELPQLTIANIKVWNRFNLDMKIIPDKGLKTDSLFTEYHILSSASDKTPYRKLWSPISIEGKPYTYVEKQNMVEMEDMAYTVGALFLIVIALLLCGIIFISNLLAKKIWSPFYDTLSRIHDFEIDKNKKPDFVASEIEEFNSLNHSLDKLIEKNMVIYRSQREFVENAAHELQTPLLLFQAKIDALAQSKGLSEEQSLLIGALNKDIIRFNRLNKNLLLLSKIDNDSYADRQQIDLTTHIKKNFDFFLEQARARSIVVSLREKGCATVYANPVLADVLFNNLFLNAITHNIAEGVIEIVVTENSLSFINTGRQTSIDQKKMFNRFSGSEATTGGNGLGLAIVKKITEVNGWTIVYTFTGDRHHFIIEF